MIGALNGAAVVAVLGLRSSPWEWPESFPWKPKTPETLSAPGVSDVSNMAVKKSAIDLSCFVPQRPRKLGKSGL